MGTVNHNALLLTTWSSNIANSFQEFINSHLSERHRGLVVNAESVVEGYTTFIVVPDGSKEGREESNDGNAMRDAIVRRIDQDAYDDGSSPWAWVEVGYGEFGQKVLRGNNENRYSDSEYCE